MKTIPRFPIILSALVCLILANCSSVTVRKYDNPEIRKIQAEETARHIGDRRTAAAIAEHIGERVSLLFVGFGDEERDSAPELPPGGRAAALTSDGYFLTACHVVEEGPFYIEETKTIRRPPPGPISGDDVDRYFSTKRYFGRLVWSDPRLDLAILKFPVTNWPHFENLKVPPEPGDIVFTADGEGRGFVPADAQGNFDIDNFIGDGSFFAAGKVRGPATRNPKSRSVRFSTTMVVRGGMSGAPLVTSAYELCGITSRIEGLGPFLTPRTAASMIEPDRLFEIIEADRKSH